MTSAILIGIDAIAATVILYFFVAGLGDGTVSSFNASLWLVTLLGLGAIIGGGFALRSAKRMRLANVVFAILAVPAVLFSLFFLILILSGARWN
jgi:hypothetical protein